MNFEMLLFRLRMTFSGFKLDIGLLKPPEYLFCVLPSFLPPLPPLFRFASLLPLLRFTSASLHFASLTIREVAVKLPLAGTALWQHPGFTATSLIVFQGGASG